MEDGIDYYFRALAAMTAEINHWDVVGPSMSVDTELRTLTDLDLTTLALAKIYARHLHSMFGKDAPEVWRSIATSTMAAICGLDDDDDDGDGHLRWNDPDSPGGGGQGVSPKSPRPGGSPGIAMTTPTI